MRYDSNLGPPAGCEGAREPAGTGPGPCPAPPGGKAEPDGLLAGVKEGAFTFSLNSRANGFSFDLGVPAGCAALLSSPMSLPDRHTLHITQLLVNCYTAGCTCTTGRTSNLSPPNLTRVKCPSRSTT